MHPFSNLPGNQLLKNNTLARAWGALAVQNGGPVTAVVLARGTAKRDTILQMSTGEFTGKLCGREGALSLK